jgi:CRISPR-associated endonuclease/helicase Cas3
MNRFLAKSNPEETIQKHTDNLVKNLKILKDLYPFIDINWNLLMDAALYHDLGKMNLKFQKRLENNNRRDPNEIAHNLLSLAFLDKEVLLKKYNEEELIMLAQAIAYHHDRGEYDNPLYEQEVDSLRKELKYFKYDKVKLTTVKKLSKRFFSNDRIYPDHPYFYEYVKIKGLLNRLDYAASAGIPVENKNTFLLGGLKKLGFRWNKLQKYMLQNQEENVIAVAQTGMGKTEAGLLWIGNNKGFYTLPIKTAINEIYKRVTGKIVRDNNKYLVGLLHSETFSKYIEYNIDEEDPLSYYTKTKQLSLPLTICTLDQIFNFVYRYRGFEPILATLSYSKIVIDEVQMYSADLLAYLILGLYYITKIGGKFAILTATLPSIILDLLKRENISFKPQKVFIDDSYIRHSLKVVHREIDHKEILKFIKNNKVLIICNTVKKAQELYKTLKEKTNLKKKSLRLFHSRFLKKDRKEIEKDIFNFGQENNNETGIWVTTQVVEASLDIDFDLLFTELSDINGLFQRMGRCFRKRKFLSNGYNCYVFDGGDNVCSGIGKIIDKNIFELSKVLLKNLDGSITESEKIDLIEKLYTTEKLKNTDYYKDLIKNIDYVKNIMEYELSKNEVIKRFRNIDNITIIPKSVYDKNKETIDELVQEIKKTNNRENNEKIWNSLLQYTLEVSYGMLRNKSLNIIDISKNKKLLVYDGFNYSKELGLTLKSKNQNVGVEIRDNFI